MSNTRKRRWGDRKDGFWVRDVTGLQTIMSNLMPNRTDCEVYLNYKLDATELVSYIEEKNRSGELEFKLTLFHCIVTGLARMVRERPLMNRFIQGRRTYERYDVSLAFVAKRRFADHAEEALMFMVPKDEDTVVEIGRKIYGDVKETRKSEHSTGGVDALVDTIAKMPRPLLMGFIKIIRILDFWGKNPDAITAGDPNYASIFCSNLGSIKCPAVYHHLNNYGTNSFMLTIGVLHKEPAVMEDGSVEIRDMIEVGATLDERIADGFYFARSLKLIEHIFAHPELLEQPLNVPSGYEYK